VGGRGHPAGDRGSQGFLERDFPARICFMSREEPTDSWYQVVIPNNDVAEVCAQALMHGFAARYREAGYPEHAEVFHPRNEDLDHIYYFSPQASAIAAKLLQKFSATACEQPKNFAIPAFKVIL
jgi:hypothetical protein